MTTFTPPAVDMTPPVSEADSRFGPATRAANPLGWRLMRHFKTRSRGVNVFKMSDGTYRMSAAVPGLNVTVGEPYPATTLDNVPNRVLAASFYDSGSGGGQTVTYPVADPHCTVVYYGGHSYTVSPAEASSLTAAGFGSYLH
jgi:hypothetical protein